MLGVYPTHSSFVKNRIGFLSNSGIFQAFAYIIPEEEARKAAMACIRQNIGTGRARQLPA